MSLWLWIKIAIIVGMLGGSWLHFKHDRDNQAKLGAAKERILHLESDALVCVNETILLNDRIRATNAEKLAELAQAQEQQDKAKADATEARAEKDQIARDLAVARKRYQEIVNGDPNLRVYQSTTVPVAVLERLRSANGENH